MIDTAIEMGIEWEDLVEMSVLIGRIEDGYSAERESRCLEIMDYNDTRL